jgi:NAD(P)-dependent dehydrogenase (short-subunit alcohol dehydrogenase family)
MAAFTDHVIVVTGASEGIGRALCLVLAPQKPRLVLAARNVDRLNELKAEVEALGAQALVVPTDVTEEAACRALIEAAVAAYGQIDVLINNAGGTMWTLMEDLEDLSIYDRLMRLNYLSAVYCTYFALPHLKKSKGRIVGLSSVAGITGVPTRTAYSASKHAMFGFFDSLRIEVAPYGVSVTMAAPDYVLSEIHRRALGKDGKPLGKSPLQEAKIMTAEACANRIVTAMEQRQRLLLTSTRGRVGRWLKLIAPGLMDNIAAKAIRDKK